MKNEIVILHIFYHSDPSTGLLPTNFQIQTPFSRANLKTGDIYSKEYVERFREEILKIYDDFMVECGVAEYDYEIKQRENQLGMDF